MKELLESEIFAVTLTFLVYFGALALQKRFKVALLNPVLVSIAVIIVFISVFNVDYESYAEGSHIIEFFLKPAVVALGVPLYQQLENIKKQAIPIIVSQLIACIVGILSVVLIAWLLGAGEETVLSLAPKSVTTPIALEISTTIGGIPSLTTAAVVITGVFGSIFGFRLLKLMKINNPIAQGLSMGAAAHALGTSRSMDVSPKYGAYASLGLILNGIFTAILTPYILQLLGFVS